MKRLIRRILSILLTLIVVSFAVFTMQSFSAGDSASYMISEEVGGAAADAYMKAMVPDDPFPVRYLSFLFSFLTGDWGRSVSGQDIAELITRKAGVTISLSFLSILLAVLIALPLSILSVRYSGLLRKAVSLSAVLIMAIPSFLTGFFLIIIFSAGLGLFPPAGYTSPSVSLLLWLRSLLLPSLTLALLHASLMIRIFRKALDENMSKPFTLSILAFGADRKSLVTRSALKPSLPVLYTLIASSLASAAAGSAVTESVFALPGIGSLLVSAALSRDARLSGIIVMLIALAVSVIYMLLECVLLAADPRTRREA